MKINSTPSEATKNSPICNILKYLSSHLIIANEGKGLKKGEYVEIQLPPEYFYRLKMEPSVVTCYWIDPPVEKIADALIIGEIRITCAK